MLVGIWAAECGKRGQVHFYVLSKNEPDPFFPQRWLLYGIGTMFSMAVLSAMVSIALKMVTAVAEAFWATALAGSLLGSDFSDGMTSQAMQQGGMGLILTALIISAPPMAAMFFQGTLGQFMAYSQFGGGAGHVGQRPGEAGYRGGSSCSQPEVNPRKTDGLTTSESSAVGSNVAPVTGYSGSYAPQPDVIKNSSTPPKVS